MLKIYIDENRCQTPYACKKCLQICPQAVFQVMVKKMVKFEETNPHEAESYKLNVGYMDKCVGCNRCLEVCPENALQITE
ncbi:MAG: 4Fe-4S binding protein [Deltaproteobacteria bacterium]|nr:4Fe-4S binding protein [Deltaproteobacteria bacterium]